MKTHTITLALALLIVAPVAATAQTPAQEEGGADDVAQWRQILAEVHTMLVDGEYETARERTTDLTNEMIDVLGVGSGAEYSLAVVTAFRAIAEAGLGNQDDALWLWRTATALYPPFAERDLTVYGDPADWLTQQEFRGDFAVPSRPTAVVAPRPVVSPAIPVPASLEGLEIAEIQIVLETVVDESGIPREPRVVKAPEVPVVVFLGLDTLRDWRFEPASLRSEPVEALQEVTLTFGG